MDEPMKKEDIVATSRKRLESAYDAERHNREMSLDDLRFITGEGQWDATTRAEREADGKVCLTINALPQYVRQVTGQIRDMNPAIRVIAGDGMASKEGAEVYEGLIRHIEYRSGAAAIYEATGEMAAACGFGAFRIRADYCDDTSFDQEVKVERIHNPFAVYFDPSAKDPTRKDAEWCLITEKMLVEDFEEVYGQKPADDVSHQSDPDWVHWRSDDMVTVAEHFWKEYDEMTIWLLDGGQVVENVPPGIKSVRSRKVRKPKVMWAKVSGTDVLEGPMEFPSKYIPVVAVTGEEWHVGEEMYRSSVIRHAKDPQRLMNYSRSAHAELIALQPKAPFLITAKQVSGLETFWNEANKQSRPYLPYNPDEKAPGAPQRVQPPVPSAGLLQEIALAAEDLKRTTGIYDAGLGARSNETSGVAIDARKQESQNSTSIYADNVVKAVEHAGCVVVDMIPRIYDTKRTIRILGEDDQEKMLTINDVMDSSEGTVNINDMTVGRYDVKVGVGPSYSTKRQESAEGMMAFVQAVPQAAAVTGDLIAKSQDWPDADRFAERLKKMLPPGIADDEKDMSPEEQQQMMQAKQAQMQEQQRQQQVMQSMEKMKMDEEEAKTITAQANAIKAQAEAEEARYKLEMLKGTLVQVIPANAGQMAVSPQ
jgi:hypothetical protein